LSTTTNRPFLSTFVRNIRGYLLTDFFCQCIHSYVLRSMLRYRLTTEQEAQAVSFQTDQLHMQYNQYLLCGLVYIYATATSRYLQSQAECCYMYG
jgi:hypothetical protein